MGAALSQLPRIVRFLDTHYAPGSQCPHCGADGARVHTFFVEDGRRLGAMSGCLKLFPRSRIVDEAARLHEKSKRTAWGLGANDRRAQQAIDDFYEGALTEQQALSVIDGVKRANSARYRGRRS